MMTSTKSLIRPSLVCVASLLLSSIVSMGCSAWAPMDLDIDWDMDQRIPWKNDSKPITNPTKVVGFWTDSVMYLHPNPPVRGFGGRIMFYDGQTDGSKKVEGGNLIVYAFVESDKRKTSSVVLPPDKKFVFEADSFESHYSQSPLGHSYSFWIPWDEVGGENLEISLILRYEPAEGAPIMGEQTSHVLPGKPSTEQKKEKEIKTVAYETKIKDSVTANTKMKTTTISLPSRFGQTIVRGAGAAENAPNSNTSLLRSRMNAHQKSELPYGSGTIQKVPTTQSETKANEGAIGTPATARDLNTYQGISAEGVHHGSGGSISQGAPVQEQDPTVDPFPRRPVAPEVGLPQRLPLVPFSRSTPQPVSVSGIQRNQ